ncbi:MAG TPA: hypothetical protein VN716_17545 [Vicinamibacterales bacterium]|nr:hypothetical protein [Vicinamibacterales bacterium]
MRSLIAAFVAACMALPLAADGQGGGAQGPAVVSPEVNPDRSVTVRLLAPKASEVLLTGEILNGKQPLALSKTTKASGASRRHRSRRTSISTPSASMV